MYRVACLRNAVNANKFLVALVILLSSGCCTCYTNLTEYKQDLRRYYTSQYYRQIDDIIKNAEAYLKQRQIKPGEKMAVVFDIDETALSNWGNLAEKLDFGYNPREFEDWAEMGEAPAIEPVLRLFNEAKAIPVTIFFITGRPSRLRSSTESNLHHAGYEGWTAVYFMPNEAIGSVAAFKTATRRRLKEEDGYTIILNVGDQLSDLEGGFAEKSVKLPNPFYIVK